MLMTVVRPLVGLAIAVLLAMSGLVLATAAPAFACSCKAVDVAGLDSIWAQHTGRADAVFVAKVDDVTEVEDAFEYAVTLTHSYQGAVERETIVTAGPATSDCALGELSAGTEYVFLVAGATPPYSVTSRTCGLTGPATARRIAEVEEVLGVGSVIQEPDPPAPTLTKVEESLPASVGRLAAPGAAMVLIGFLGLFVVRRLSRS